MESPACKEWCTRDELVELAAAKQGLRDLTTPELTEVLRGKKHKVALGLESQKIESGDILYRFVSGPVVFAVVSVFTFKSVGEKVLVCCIRDISDG